MLCVGFLWIVQICLWRSDSDCWCGWTPCSRCGGWWSTTFSSREVHSESLLPISTLSQLNHPRSSLLPPTAILYGSILIWSSCARFWAKPLPNLAPACLVSFNHRRIAPGEGPWAYSKRLPKQPCCSIPFKGEKWVYHRLQLSAPRTCHGHRRPPTGRSGLRNLTPETSGATERRSPHPEQAHTIELNPQVQQPTA